MALRCKESKNHSATNCHDIYFAEQVGDNSKLVGNLRSPKNYAVWASWIGSELF